MHKSILGENLWVFHCNLVMMAVDSGAFVLDANIAVANFIQTVYGADVKVLDEWKSLDMESAEIVLIALYCDAVNVAQDMMDTTYQVKLYAVIAASSLRNMALISGNAPDIYCDSNPEIDRIIRNINDRCVLDIIIQRAFSQLSGHRVEAIRNRC